MAVQRLELDQRTRVQIDEAIDLVRRVLGDDVVAAWLHGSAIAGGLRHDSDVDILVVARRPTSPEQRQELIGGLLPISGRRAAAGPARPIELTIVVESDVRPWRYPTRVEFQYGDWWRLEFEAGQLAPWHNPNPDLAILLAAVRGASAPLIGPPAIDVLDPVPRADLVQAMLDAIPDLLADLDSDTRNVILTLARIWTTVATGEIRPKDGAADWALARLPEEQRPVLERARAIYLGQAPERWDDLLPRVPAHAEHVVAQIRRAVADPTPPDGEIAAR